MMGGTGTKPANSTVNGEAMWLTSIAARHGKLSANGNNANTNIAFFDGHVALLPTQPFADYVAPSGTGGGPNIPQSAGAVFTLTQDR
jgi:prepilin-type processing-associated H-X9-DG protein